MTGIVAGMALGWITAAAAVVGVYLWLSRREKPRPAIRGYLDLIDDLTDEQRRRVEEIRVTFLPVVAAIREELRRGRAELAELLFDEPVDRDRIGAVTQSIASAQRRLEDEIIAHILEERDLLTPSQQRRFYEIIVRQFSAGSLGVHDVGGGPDGRRNGG